ncbi:MAG: DUF58 domain-containing protein, partial [Lachnospiraceae bacterium]
KICIVIENRSRIPWTRTRCRITYTNSMTAGKQKLWLNLATVHPGENRFETYVHFSGAGDYCFSLDTVRIYDLTGLFSLKKHIHTQQNLKILPELEEVQVFLTEPVRNFYGDSDQYDEKRPGNDRSEIFQIRPFQDGDRLQQIHWKLSAKVDELIVREDSFPKACPVVLFLDYVAVKKGHTLTADVFLSAAASLSMSLMAKNCPHYIVWYCEAQQDLVRVRVDDEESLYFFFNYYLEDTHTTRIPAMEARYHEKYVGEVYLHAYFLNETLCLTDKKELNLTLEKQHWRQQMQELELVV